MKRDQQQGEGRVARRDQPQSYRRAFWIAVAITTLAWLIPFGGLAIYPFSLLATWAHEMGHGLAALLTGGSFHRLEIFVGLSGLATTASSGALAAALIAAGGLVGPPLLGALIVAIGPRAGWSRGILAALALALLLSLLLWVRNPFGAVAVALLAGALALAGWRLGAWHRFILVQLLGIQLGLSALRGWRYLFTESVSFGGREFPSDVAAIARVAGGTYWLWGALILAAELGLLYGAYRLVGRRLRRQATAPGR